jgi:hypothetical protein
MYKIYAEKRPHDFSGPEDHLAPRTIPLDESLLKIFEISRCLFSEIAE